MSEYIFEKKETVRINGRKTNIYQVWEEQNEVRIFCTDISGRNETEAKENFYDIFYS